MLLWAERTEHVFGLSADLFTLFCCSRLTLYDAGGSVKFSM